MCSCVTSSSRSGQTSASILRVEEETMLKYRGLTQGWLGRPQGGKQEIGACDT